MLDLVASLALRPLALAIILSERLAGLRRDLDASQSDNARSAGYGLLPAGSRMPGALSPVMRLVYRRMPTTISPSPDDSRFDEKRWPFGGRRS